MSKRENNIVQSRLKKISYTNHCFHRPRIFTKKCAALGEMLEKKNECTKKSRRYEKHSRRGVSKVDQKRENTIVQQQAKDFLRPVFDVLLGQRRRWRWWSEQMWSPIEIGSVVAWLEFGNDVQSGGGGSAL